MREYHYSKCCRKKAASTQKEENRWEKIHGSSLRPFLSGSDINLEYFIRRFKISFILAKSDQLQSSTEEPRYGDAVMIKWKYLCAQERCKA
jgi:hypothetical protein